MSADCAVEIQYVAALRLIAQLVNCPLEDGEAPSLHRVFLSVPETANGPGWLLLTKGGGRYFLQEITNDAELKARTDFLVPGLCSIEEDARGDSSAAAGLILAHLA